MRGQMIRHSVYGIGLVINSRSYVLKQTKTTVVCWGVSFVDAPGGPQKFEMEEVALVEAVKLFKEWEKNREIPMKTNGTRYLLFIVILKTRKTNLE